MTFFSRKKPGQSDVRDYQNFRELLTEAASAAGDTVAVKYKTKKSLHDVTYNELLSKIDSLGTGLSGLTGENKRVALLCQKGFPFIAVYLTVLCSTGVIVPIDTELPFIEIVNILNHSDCDSLFFDKSFLPQIEEYRKSLPKIRNYLCVGLKEHEEDPAKRLFSYAALLERGQNALFDGDEEYISKRPAGEETRMLLYKSGSTDSLYGVCLSQRALLREAAGFVSASQLRGRGLSVQSFARPFELICGLLGAFFAHATVCLSAGLKNFQRDLLDYQPDYTLLPPLYAENIASKILNSLEEQGRYDTFRTLVKTSNAMRKIGIDRRRTFFEKPLSLLGGKLSTLIVSGAQIDPEAVRFFDNIGVPVFFCYGTPESCSAALYSSEPAEEGVCRGLLLPGFEAFEGEDAGNGSKELLIAGDQVFSGYYKNESATSERFDAEGRCRTGLLGNIGQKITVTGKIKNEIELKNGRTVLPEEIGSYLEALPFVKSARVYAGKDARGAELHLCADIQLDARQLPGQTGAEKAAVVKEKLEKLNAGLPSYKRVKVVHIKK